MTGKSHKVPGTKFIRHDEPSAVRGIHGEIMVFCGSASQDLGQEIVKYLSLTPGQYKREKFSNENIFIRLDESVRGHDVFWVQTMASPVSDNIMELLIMLDTLKRDSAGRITAVIPYLSYARSDKKDQPRVPITARLIAEMVQIAGADRYITIDLHAGQIQGFFSIPGDVLTASYLIGDHIAELEIEDLVIVTTDLGYAKRGRNFANSLGCPLALIEKRRADNAEQPEVLSLIGDVKGKNVVLVDDEALTGKSIVNAAQTVLDHGANDIYLAFTHAILSEGAVERLATLPFKEIITTNTLSIPAEKRLPNMTILSVAPLLAEVMIRSHDGRSVGALFDE